MSKDILDRELDLDETDIWSFPCDDELGLLLASNFQPAEWSELLINDGETLPEKMANQGLSFDKEGDVDQFFYDRLKEILSSGKEMDNNLEGANNQMKSMLIELGRLYYLLNSKSGRPIRHSEDIGELVHKILTELMLFMYYKIDY